jgi:hypothetical protein
VGIGYRCTPWDSSTLRDDVGACWSYREYGTRCTLIGCGRPPGKEGVVSDNEPIVGTAIDLDAEDAVERLVMGIKRRGPGRALPAADPRGVAAFLTHVATEEPMSVAEHLERERLWRAVDAAVEALDSTPHWPEDSVAGA